MLLSTLFFLDRFFLESLLGSLNFYKMEKVRRILVSCTNTSCANHIMCSGMYVVYVFTNTLEMPTLL